MIQTSIIDTIMASISQYILLHTIYKYLVPKKFAKLMQFLIPILFSFLFYAFAYSNFLSNLIPNASIRQIFITISIFICLICYIMCFFTSDLSRKLVAFMGSVIAMISAEVTIVFFLLPFGIDSNNARQLPLEQKLLINTAVLFLYTVYCVAVYFIFKNYNSHFPWKITFNMCCIIISCVLLFILIINVTSANLYYLRVAVCVAFTSILVLVLSLISIIKYMNNQQLEKENIYWKNQLHDLNIKFSQTYNEKAMEIRNIQHDFHDNLALIKLLIADNTAESQEKANKLLSELSNKIDESKLTYYINNISINALLNNKIVEAKKKGITLTPYVDIPYSIDLNEHIKDFDLDVLLINLLNNAIDACANLDNNIEPKITVKLAIKGNFLFIKTINPYSKIIFNKNNFSTTKTDKDNHGLGMAIIQNIVKTYNGSQTITTNDGKFTHIISLDLDTKTEDFKQCLTL